MSPISSRAIANLAKPFAGGAGLSHVELDVAFAAGDADEYLPAEGNKQTRVLTGLRTLRNGGRVEPGAPVLEADHQKLALVAEHLASGLLASNWVEYEEVAEALDSSPTVATKEASPSRHPIPSAQASALTPAPTDPGVVMIVHGQDEPARKAMFGWLRSIDLKPREWTQLVADTKSGAPYIGDVLDMAFQKAGAVVVLFTPDEHVLLREGLRSGKKQWRMQARPNVMFEAGAALARHPDRTVLVVWGDQELPSDLAGRHYVRLGSVKSLRDLASRLRNAGCPVNESGDDWLDPDQFPSRSFESDPDS